VRLIVLVSEEDEAGAVWAGGLAREWADELSDPRQDLYTLADGQLIDAAR
jgi:adenosyl cobinamide kinase/adenosyl cobinamide phosphate guanylyltransferase